MSDLASIAVIGSGGHARVVAAAIRAMTRVDDKVGFAGFIDKAGGEFVIGSDDELPALRDRGTITHFCMGIGAVKGGPSLRSRLFDKFVGMGLDAAVVVHPDAIVDPDVKLLPGVFVSAGAVINIGGHIGENAIINTGAVVDHDASVGAHTHVAPGVSMSGDVTIGKRCLVGVGASVLQGIHIGDDATIGAGSVVVKPVGDGQTTLGNPAKLR